jgi:hypothetical protein
MDRGVIAMQEAIAWGWGEGIYKEGSLDEV